MLDQELNPWLYEVNPDFKFVPTGSKVTDNYFKALIKDLLSKIENKIEDHRLAQCVLPSMAKK